MIKKAIPMRITLSKMSYEDLEVMAKATIRATIAVVDWSRKHIREADWAEHRKASKKMSHSDHTHDR